MCATAPQCGRACGLDGRVDGRVGHGHAVWGAGQGRWVRGQMPPRWGLSGPTAPPPRPLLMMLLSLTLGEKGSGECAVCAHTLLAAAHSCGHTGAALPPLLGRDCRWTDLPRFQGPRTPTLTLGTAEGREPSWRTRLVEVAARHGHLCPASRDRLASGASTQPLPVASATGALGTEQSRRGPSWARPRPRSLPGLRAVGSSSFRASPGRLVV